MMTTISPTNVETYSFSKLTAFEQCPYQYYLNYVADDRPQKENNAMAEYGSMCHEILERYYKGDLEPFELNTAYEEGYSKIAHAFPDMFSVDLATKYYEDGLSFFDNIEELNELPSRDQIIGIEKDVYVPFEKRGDVEPFQMHGFIDLLYSPEPSKFIVWDWKSKSKFKSKKEQAHYRRQLYVYSAAIKEEFGCFPDTLTFYCFRSQQAYSSLFSIKEYEDTMDWIYDTVKRIRECEIFEQNRTEEFMCNELCDFRSTCEENQIGLL